MCSDVPCACMYVFLLFLSVTTVYNLVEQTLHRSYRFGGGGVFNLFFSITSFRSSRYCLTTSGFSTPIVCYACAVQHKYDVAVQHTYECD